MGYGAFCCFPVSDDLKSLGSSFFFEGGGGVFRVYMIGIEPCMYIYICIYIYI